MEEARQYPALRRLSVALYWAKYVPFLLGVLAQVVWRGRFLQFGLTLFAICGFLSWCLAIPDSARFGWKRQRAVIVNAALWFVIALATGLSVNASLIWGR